jgi:hypothetical protein
MDWDYIVETCTRAPLGVGTAENQEGGGGRGGIGGRWERRGELKTEGCRAAACRTVAYSFASGNSVFFSFSKSRSRLGFRCSEYLGPPHVTHK